MSTGPLEFNAEEIRHYVAGKAVHCGAIRQMVYHGKAWLDGNTGKVKINLPPWQVISTIDDAKKSGLLQLNADAESFVNRMTCQTPGATVIMLKLALELLKKELAL